MAQKFSYSPLNLGNFRLLKIIRDDEIKEIGISFITSPIQDGLPFEALSYCWSGHERRLSREEYNRRIQMNHKINVYDEDREKPPQHLFITKSLAEALEKLAAQVRRPLFVDQLCINQQDSKEKSRLVSAMGHIYATAERVLAWLGPSTFETELFGSFLEDLVQDAAPAFVRLADHDYSTIDSVRQYVVAKDASLAEAPPHIAEDCVVLRQMACERWARFPFDGFVQVFSRQWFGRMWIVQEACLPIHLDFVCGTNVWTIDDIKRTTLFCFMSLGHRASTLTEATVKEYPRPNDIIYAMGLVRLATRLFSVRRTIQVEGEQRLSLFHLLTRFNVSDPVASGTMKEDLQKFTAGNARDCCYSILALPDSADKAVQRVVVDYEKPVSQVFLELVQAIVPEHTDIILFSQNSAKNVELFDTPSWVPDWSSSIQNPHGYQQSSRPLFSAGISDKQGSLTIPRMITTQGRVLTIYGRRVDIIERIGAFVHGNRVSLVRTKPAGDKPSEGFARFSEEEQPAEVPLHYFLCEIESFCRMARNKKMDGKRTSSPPCGRETEWLMASGGRGLAREQNASAEERFGPTVKGVRALEAAYHIYRDYAERHTKTHEFFGWQTPRLQVMRESSANWQIVAARPSSYYRTAHILGSWDPWFSKSLCDDYEFYEKLNHYWRRLGEWPQTLKVNSTKDGSQLDDDVREAGSHVSGRLGLAMDLQKGRKCFLTPEGFVGLGPREMEMEDVVVVLQGATVPMILRQHVGTQDYRYVGEAYCHGIMDGEFYNTCSESLESFRLV